MPQSSSSSNAGVDADFREQISKGKDVFVEQKEIKGDLNFTELASAYTITPGARRVEIGGGITFYKCQFKGKVSAYQTDKAGIENTATVFAKNLTFIECTFEEEVNFRACSVQDLACFSDCFFLKKAVFEEADFAHYAVFAKSQFKGEVRFQNAFFRKKADFLRAEFLERVNFQGAAFTLDAQFGAMKSNKSADFATAQFGGHAFFNYAEYSGQAAFDETWFKGRAEFIQTKFGTASFKNSHFFSTPRFDKAEVQTKLDMMGCRYLDGKPNWEGIEKGKILQD